jgi:hypothetical protein
VTRRSVRASISLEALEQRQQLESQAVLDGADEASQ